MIVDCNFLAENNADDLLPYKPYRSGIIEGQKAINDFAYPSIRYPILNLAYILSDFEGNKLPPGHYEVILSADRKTLYLVESNKVKATIPVANLVEKMVNDDEEREKLLKKAKLEKKYKNNPKKRPRDTTDMIEQASMEATIESTESNYYVLHYKNGNIKATGYILK